MTDTHTVDSDTWPVMLSPAQRQQLFDQKFQRALAVIQQRRAVPALDLDCKFSESDHHVRKPICTIANQ